jgi:Ca2+-binding EF-hand superfamily protein/subtilisin-like proprotein convertase family protein
MKATFGNTRTAVVFLLTLAVPTAVVQAQSGLRESLERLDVNENGVIEPEEVTPLARPYLERILNGLGKRSKSAFDRPVTIEKIQESARIYHALKNGVAGTRVEPQGKSTVKPFGNAPDEVMVPHFGLAEVKLPYTQEDLDQAYQTLFHDDNKDGQIDREEAKDVKWTHRNPFDDDLNHDERLSTMELVQRYARRRLLAGDSDQLVQKAMRTGGDIRPTKEKGKQEDQSQWWRQGGSSHWLTAAMMGRFDANRNGRLEANEAFGLRIPLGRIDIDRDGEVTRDELHAHVSQMQDEAGDLTEGLPGWFYELDADDDGQVAMHEFATEWSLAKREEFASFDINGDGLLTSSEILQSTAIIGGSYRNEDAEVLPPRRTIISEIEIEDDFLIYDLDVELSITHSHVGYLDGYLTGPDGMRVELFSDIGAGGDHFDETTFDDAAEASIAKTPAPFKGRFRPIAMEKKQPGLSSFNGKTVQGVWQLVIRGSRSDRFGMLHSWGMSIKPQEEFRPSSLAADADNHSVEEPTSVDGKKEQSAQAAGSALLDLLGTKAK